MVAVHDRLAIGIKKMNVERTPMPEELPHHNSEESLFLLGRVHQVAASFIADTIFIAGFKTDELGNFEDLLHEQSMVVT
jgi:hypothetical protein